MNKLVFCIMLCLCFACSFEEPRRNGEEKTFQIFCEDKREKEGFNSEDVETVMSQAGVSEEDARKALSETHDLAEAILKLKKK